MLKRWMPSVAPVIALAFVAACAPADDPDAMTEDTQETAPAAETEPAEPTMEPPTTVDFVPGPAAGENVTGVLQIESMGADTQLRVTLSGLTPGEHAWHIHGAACGTDGPIVLAITPTSDMEGIGEAITADENGMATQTATVPATQLTREQLTTGTYSLHVHESGGTEPGATVVCADLAPAGMSPAASPTPDTGSGT